MLKSTPIILSTLLVLFIIIYELSFHNCSDMYVPDKLCAIEHFAPGIVSAFGLLISFLVSFVSFLIYLCKRISSKQREAISAKWAICFLIATGLIFLARSVIAAFN